VPRLQAQEILHCSHNKLYNLLREGELQALKDGARTLITIQSIRRYQASRPRATFLPPAPRQNNFHTLKKKRPIQRRRSKARA
jgi:CBS-domain-containing membrane protein